MIAVTIWCRGSVCSRNFRGEGKGQTGETDGRTDNGHGKLERSDDLRRCRKKWVEEGNPSEASQECWSDKLLSEPGGISRRQYLLQGGPGHRAKPVLNALLNFTNLRRAVNHLGGSTRVRLLLLSYLAGRSTRRVPPRWDLPTDPPYLPPVAVVLRITYHPNPDIQI